MKILMFEGDDSHLLYPLTYLRPAFELRCGAFSLRQKVQGKFPDCELFLETRAALREVATDLYGSGPLNGEAALKPDDDVLLVKAGAILTGRAENYGKAEHLATTEAGDFVWALVRKEMVAEMAPSSAVDLAAKVAERFKGQPSDDILIRYPWDLITHNPSQIKSDFDAAFGPKMEGRLNAGAAVYGDRKNLHIAKGAEVQPHTFIDCREGPVILGPNVVVYAHTSIQGPAFIGEESRLLEARIREGTSIGPVCRVGGEVEESIIHANSNKYHSGFLGHSYVCEWVNLGAMTTNSDLKNDYSAVSVPLNGQPADTGSMKVGCFIGDHTKTSIGTLLNTGSVIGVMCNLVAGASVLPKYVPSFCWYLDSRISKGLGLAQALDTARAAMKRRGVELTDAMVKLIKYTEDLTRADKMEKVQRDRRKAFR